MMHLLLFCICYGSILFYWFDIFCWKAWKTFDIFSCSNGEENGITCPHADDVIDEENALHIVDSQYSVILFTWYSFYWWYERKNVLLFLVFIILIIMVMIRLRVTFCTFCSDIRRENCCYCWYRYIDVTDIDYGDTIAVIWLIDVCCYLGTEITLLLMPRYLTIPICCYWLLFLLLFGDLVIPYSVEWWWPLLLWYCCYICLFDGIVVVTIVVRYGTLLMIHCCWWCHYGDVPLLMIPDDCWRNVILVFHLFRWLFLLLSQCYSGIVIGNDIEVLYWNTVSVVLCYCSDWYWPVIFCYYWRSITCYWRRRK